MEKNTRKVLNLQGTAPKNIKITEYRHFSDLAGSDGNNVKDKDALLGDDPTIVSQKNTPIKGTAPISSATNGINVTTNDSVVKDKDEETATDTHSTTSSSVENTQSSVSTAPATPGRHLLFC